MKLTLSLLSLLLPLVMQVNGCVDPAGSHGHRLSARADDETDSGTGPYDPGWGWANKLGAFMWHSISSDYSACATGRFQSPIVLYSSSSLRNENLEILPPNSVKVQIKAGPQDIEVTNSGWSIQAELNATVHALGKEWGLEQFHVHTPSEHWLNEVHMDAEVHYVFSRYEDGQPGQAHIDDGPGNHAKRDEGSTGTRMHWKSTTDAPRAKKYLVIGLLLSVEDKSSPHSLLSSVYLRTPEIPNYRDSFTLPMSRFSRKVIPAWTKRLNKSSYYYYRGSFTTPPCTEGVEWFISTKTYPIELKVFQALKAVIKSNSRFPQSAPGEKNLIKAASDAFAMVTKAEL